MSIEPLRLARDLYRSPEAQPGHSPAWFSACVDDWVRQTSARLLPDHDPTIVLALGGYGREELFPFSDIDLLVCMPESAPPDSQFLAENLFVPLWDSGFDVGHGIRTLPETLALASEDFEVLISLLDARLISGPADVFSAFRSAVIERLVIPLRVEILPWLARRHDERHRRFGDAAHLLSPNLKEGRGAARPADHALARCGLQRRRRRIRVTVILRKDGPVPCVTGAFIGQNGSASTRQA